MYFVDTTLQNTRKIKKLLNLPTKHRIPFQQLFLNKLTYFNRFEDTTNIYWCLR
jgi:hypothetical protein